MARGRTSMRGRLERLQGEAAANEREKEEKRKQKAEADRIKAMSPGGATRAKKKPAAKSMPGATRMKMVWAICDRRAETVKTFPYPQKAQAQAELERMNAESELKDQHVLQQRRVPMDA